MEVFFLSFFSLFLKRTLCYTFPFGGDRVPQKGSLCNISCQPPSSAMPNQLLPYQALYKLSLQDFETVGQFSHRQTVEPHD